MRYVLWGLLMCYPDLVEHASGKESMERCRADYPALLARADRELEPWEHTGITREMLDQLWRCDEGDSTRANGALAHVRRFVGLRAVISQGNMHVEKAVMHKSKLHYTRPETLELMLRSVHKTFDIPDVEFTMSTADHLDQSFNPRKGGQGASLRRVDGRSFNASLAPILVAYRRQQDRGTIAGACPWSFFTGAQ